MARGPHTNRIKELRELAGMTQDQLAERMKTLPQQIGKHERGERRLTIQWIQRYAAALEVAPADLIAGTVTTDMQSEVEIATVEGMPGVSTAIALRGLRIYRVLTSLIPDAGIVAGQYVTVDESEAGIARAAAGDVVLARYEGTEALILRQFVPPYMLVTNIRGSCNSMLRLDDRSVLVKLVGLVIRE